MNTRRRLSKTERQAIYDKMGGHCAYCGCELTLENMQVDHKIPVKLYETDAITNEELNSIKNLLPACRSCNHYKDTLTVEKFRQLIERGPEILARDSVAYRAAVRFGTVKPNPKKVVFFFERAERGEDILKRERVDF